MGFECKYCSRIFKYEKVFAKHECTPMRRASEIQTPDGRMAYGLYCKWMEFKRQSSPSIETFMISSFYEIFLKFTRYCKEFQVASPESYIKLMVNNKIQPTAWRHPEAFKMYLDWHDKHSHPLDQANITVNTFLALSDIMSAPTAEVLSQLEFSTVKELISQRKLSPWLLFCSQKFKDWLGKQDPSDRQLLMKQIGVDYWSYKLEANPKVVKELKQIAVALGI